MSMPSREAVGEVCALIVHDLRNPAAAISANLAYVRTVVDSLSEATSADEIREALDDATTALRDLMRGVDQMAILGRWLGGKDGHDGAPGDVATEVRTFVGSASHLPLEHHIASDPMPTTNGAGVVSRILELLVANSQQHAGASSPIQIRAKVAGGRAVVELQDRGPAIAPELRPIAFTFEGQTALKGRLDGRYGRVVGLFAAAAVAESIGATLEADGENGAAIFRVTIPLRAA